MPKPRGERSGRPSAAVALAIVMPHCDTHIHFYNDTYAVAPAATLTPPNASVDDYAAVQVELGLERVVVVQPTTYGLDNRCQLEAMARIGDAARGVMVIDADVQDSTLWAYTDLGVRGARFHMLPGGAVGWEHLEPVAERLIQFGWHVQLQLDGHELAGRREQLLRLPCPLVIDHVGRFMGPVEPESDAFSALLDLVDAGAHVKLSAPYESALDPTHEYEIVSRCIDELVRRAPDRLLWASNWPHPGQAEPPTNQDLGRLRDRWLGDPAVRTQVMSTNPAALYDF